MNERMKVLVAYDSSTYADAALEDLRRAGLPREAEALIVSVSDSLVNPSSSIAEIAGSALTSGRVTSTIALVREQAALALEEAKEFAAKAGDRVRSYFPDWEVRAEGIAGTPSQELVQRADKWKADLVVVGSQGRSALGRFFLGSVSKAVATEANCSVRVVRPAVEKRDDARLRIIVGVDGSPGARRAVRAVGNRVWPEGTEVHIIAVDDGVSPARIADINPGAAELITVNNEEESVKARVMLDSAAEELRTLALTALTVIKEGDPQTVMIEEAQNWAADCIFVGALGFNTALKRSGLGSVAMGLVTNAPRAVEIVR